MVNATTIRSPAAVLLLAVFVLTSAAWLRGAEYDEQYTLFLTAGSARPDWPDRAFPAGDVASVQSGHATLPGIAHDLRTTDVHPPLYFWGISLWRDAFGPSLFTARMASVMCGLVSLGLIGIIARRCVIPPVAPMLLTLGCYGFVYTNVISRGFAPAQLLTLAGVALLLWRRPLLAGACLGAACCCNYLAVFAAAASVATAGAWPAILTAAPFLALDAWFFAAQHATRSGQFPPFALWPSLLRLAEYQTAAVFGGLPLYVDGPARLAVGAIVGMATAGLVFYVVRARPLRAGPAVRLLLAAALAPPVGLLLLGAVFDNTPIELRYLSFGLPFIALLIAWTSPPCHGGASVACRGRALCWCHRRAIKRASEGWPGHSRFYRCQAGKTWVAGPSPAMTRGGSPAMTQRTARRAFIPSLLLPLILAVQLASIGGLMLSPRTMQPARAAAGAAARLAGDGIVLVPRGNDGAGIVGAFGIEAPPALPMLLISPDEPIAARLAPYRRAALALLAQDRDSTAAIALAHTVLTQPNWRLVEIGSNLEVYERAAKGE